jgi:hypothetical protein
MAAEKIPGEFHRPSDAVEFYEHHMSDLSSLMKGEMAIYLNENTFYGADGVEVTCVAVQKPDEFYENGEYEYDQMKQPDIGDLTPREAELHKRERNAAFELKQRSIAAQKTADEAFAKLSDLGRSQDATEMLIDNKGVVDITHDPGAVHARSKHIHRRYFYIRELVQSGEFRVNFVAGDANVADIFTKPLQAARFKLLRAQLMNLPAPRD